MARYFAAAERKLKGHDYKWTTWHQVFSNREMAMRAYNSMLPHNSNGDYVFRNLVFGEVLSTDTGEEPQWEIGKLNGYGSSAILVIGPFSTRESAIYEMDRLNRTRCAGDNASWIWARFGDIPRAASCVVEQVR